MKLKETRDEFKNVPVKDSVSQIASLERKAKSIQHRQHVLVHRMRKLGLVAFPIKGKQLETVKLQYCFASGQMAHTTEYISQPENTGAIKIMVDQYHELTKKCKHTLGAAHKVRMSGMYDEEEPLDKMSDNIFVFKGRQVKEARDEWDNAEPATRGAKLNQLTDKMLSLEHKRDAIAPMMAKLGVALLMNDLQISDAINQGYEIIELPAGMRAAILRPQNAVKAKQLAQRLRDIHKQLFELMRKRSSTRLVPK